MIGKREQGILGDPIFSRTEERADPLTFGE
jgi:hypothetical protein